MTDNTKMRDDAIREAARNHATDEYFKARPQLMRTPHEECLFEAGFDRAWQAAQSVQSVPVVGEPVAWTVQSPCDFSTDFSEYQTKTHTTPLVVQPTTSITTAELERLRKDAERYRWIRSSSVGPATVWHVCMEHLEGGLQTLKSDHCLDEAIDAAIAAEWEKE